MSARSSSRDVFKQPVQLTENVERVTKHALATLHADGNREAYRRTLTDAIASGDNMDAMEKIVAAHC